MTNPDTKLSLQVSSYDYEKAFQLLWQGMRLTSLKLENPQIGPGAKVRVGLTDLLQTRSDNFDMIAIGQDTGKPCPIESIHPGVLLLMGLFNHTQAVKYVQRDYGMTGVTAQEVALIDGKAIIYRPVFIPEKRFETAPDRQSLLDRPIEELFRREQWRYLFFPVFYHYLVDVRNVGKAQYPEELRRRGLVTNEEKINMHENLQLAFGLPGEDYLVSHPLEREGRFVSYMLGLEEPYFRLADFQSWQGYMRI